MYVKRVEGGGVWRGVDGWMVGGGRRGVGVISILVVFG